jgi:hypothetical protein|tara:strand:- start:3808 stop:4191 length:384 start_codon:yes stop_codon:yes gene_type:complete
MPAGYYGLVKLMNGEEILTRVVEDDGEYLLFEDPVIMYRSISPNGMTWIQCSHWLLFNKTNIITVHKSKVIAIADDLHENIISNYERFLKEGYTEMSSQNEDIAEQRKRTKQMVEALGVGDANTTYH